MSDANFRSAAVRGRGIRLTDLVFGADPDVSDLADAARADTLDEMVEVTGLRGNIGAVLEATRTNGERLDAITHLNTTVGDFAAITLAVSNQGFHSYQTAGSIRDSRAGDFGLPSTSYDSSQTIQVGVSVPAGANVARVRMVLNRGGTKTYYPSDATASRLIQFDVSASGNYLVPQDYYYLANADDDDPFELAVQSGDWFYMEVAAESHTYVVSLEEVEVAAWQDQTAAPSAAPSDAQTEKAYIQGGLTPFRFERFRGTRRFHFQVPDSYEIDLISLQGENVIEEFTVSTSGGLRRYDSTNNVSNNGSISTLVRVIEASE